MRGIKKLLKIPLTIHPFQEKDDHLDIVYGPPIHTTCYGEGKIQIVTNTAGKEVVSNLMIYVDGSDVLRESDKLTYYNKDYLIKALNAVRELDGEVALWVVYV